jgi:hypothetical protein
VIALLSKYLGWLSADAALIVAFSVFCLGVIGSTGALLGLRRDRSDG